MSPNQIKSWIEEGMPGAEVSVVGDGRHFEAVIISELFAGKSMIEQHRMVYHALGEKMGNEIHALSLKTKLKK